MSSYSAHTYDRPGEDALDTFQQEKIVQYLKLVKWIVARIIERIPQHIDEDDLTHSGILGLIDAVKRFSWGREREDEEFRAYAECRIRGRIMDELRSMDVLPRSARERAKKYKKSVAKLQQQLKREPTDQELCEELNVDIEACHQMRAEANFGVQMPLDTCQSRNETFEGILRKTLDIVDPDSPEAQFHLEEVKRILVEEIGQLSEKEQQVVSLYYFEELTLKEIGVVLSVSESRISQIRTQALERLMRRLKQNFGLDSESMEGT